MEERKSLSKLSNTQVQINVAAKVKENLKTFKTGANDVVVVRQANANASYKATPLHIRIGKLSSWTKSMQSKGKYAFTKQGARKTGGAIERGTIKTASIFVNGLKVLEHIEFALSESGDEILIHREKKEDTSGSSNMGTINKGNSLFSRNTFNNEELNAMSLKNGKNQVLLRAGEDLLNTEIHFSIFLLNQHDRLLFTDIDGTITKSDVMGFLGGSLENYLPSIMGKRFTTDVHHTKVVQFLHKASKNGYVVIYLTARPIDFDIQTRKYLFNALQNRDGGYSLPESPLFSGNKNVNAENGTVSYDPKIVKLSTVKDILSLFDLKEKVVYGAFGNKSSDAMAYSESGIPHEKIYLIDETGSITQMKNSKITSYEEISNNIDSLFPPNRPSGIR